MSVNILLIDDHAAVERVFSFLLNDTVYKDASLVHYLTVEGALEAISTFPPSVIFLDNRIPPYRDFTEPLEQLQKLNLTCPVILMTGSDLSDLGYETVPAGFAGFLSKTRLTADSVAAMLDEVL